ncbi:MAG: TM0996/MTH895 family glutaredoxin-like protein [Spirochaetes bacterium]|nr:TM0996/MTH895 family glutaredoxin-like protein [Spirochaetota bacterium]MBN2770433.1 TM0996/MTH895 family glutaredoxin-like protein [Spirochaetota bacterium]
MIIKILGSGCPKCKQLEEEARKAVSESGTDADIIKVSDMDQIMDYGVMMTPALVIDEEVKSVGKVLKAEEIKTFF